MTPKGNVLLAIDPAVSYSNAAGWAVFVKGKLHAFGQEALPEVRSAHLADIFLIADAISTAVPRRDVSHVVVEFPQDQGARGFAKDSYPLAGLAGAVSEKYRARGAAVTLVTPNTWKKTQGRGSGAVPKKIQNMRDREKLTEEEKQLTSHVKSNNIWDAIGIGLWALNRK